MGGGARTPNKDQDKAWGTLQKDFGLGVIKVAIDLNSIFPTNENDMDSNALSNYTHVAGSIISRANGAGIKVMLEFTNLPSWLDSNGDKIYDDLIKYQTVIRNIYTEIYNTWKDSGVLKFVEIVPNAGLSAENFSRFYYETAKVIRSVDSNITIGGAGYELTSPSDGLNENVTKILNDFRDTSEYKNLLQYVSVRAYSLDLMNSYTDVFGEFKHGRKTIRNESGNADLPLFLTGWSTTGKGAGTANNTITGVEGIRQQASALFKAMRDGWKLVLFDSMASDAENPGSFAYTINESGEVTPNPFVRVYQLFKCLGLNQGNFKVISTDMGSNWVVDDSIAMMNSNKEAVMFLSNFNQVKSDVSLELRNVPYEDGNVSVKIYVAADGQSAPSLDTPFDTIAGTVVNGNLNITIPNIPVGAMGIVVTGGTERVLEAQSLYEFESQDNHFGGNTEITWTNGASFNRTVQGFGGENNFVALKKVAADGTGSYTMKLYAASTNSQVKVVVNDGPPIAVDAASIGLNSPIELDINLEAGNNNTIKVYTSSGELKPDRVVLVPKNVQLSIGFQNLNTLGKEGDKYILPLTKTDFELDARIFPANAASGKSLQFTSSDETCASINASGLITPLKEGETTITAAIAEEPTITASFQLKIENTISSVVVSPKNVVLLKGETAAINVTVSPDNVENKNIEWSMSAEGLEIVSKNNNEIVVRAVKDTGIINVTAKAEAGGLSDSCLVTLNKLGDGGLVVSDFGSTTATGHPEIFGITHYPSINPEDGDIGDHSMVWDMLRNTGGVRFMRADARLQEILPIWTKKENTNWQKPAAGSFDPSIQPNYVISELYKVTGPDGVERQFSVDGYREDMEHFKQTGEYVNGMSNPDNWNTGRLLRWVRKAKETGFEVMVMTFQIPEWLASGYPAPGAPHTEKACNSAPKDWEIYRDIVKKVYKLMKDEGVDYYEFLNEPHWYVPKGGDQRDPAGNAYTGSGADFANAVAADQFYQAIDAIYEFEKEETGDPAAEPQMLLGGGADDSWGGTYGVLGHIFSDKYADWKNRIDFVSIHKYGQSPANENNSNDGGNARNLKYWLREKAGRNISLFLNEYNISTGQPTEETYGVKSLGWHTKNLIDMMTDEFSGGGYYTCYPADVPMDDYEASSGWIERGKGMYTWNSGDPYLATFTKAWDLMSRRLCLGDGEFLVKAADVSGSKATQGIAAVNVNGAPVIVLNNYAGNTYGKTTIKLNNLPFMAGTNVSAEIYNMDMNTSVDEPPVTKETAVDENGQAELVIDRLLPYGVTGILLNGTIVQKYDKTYEMESYLNQLSGAAKINAEETASNKRWVVNTEGKTNCVEIPVTFDQDGLKNISVSYSSSVEGKLFYRVNDGEEVGINLQALSSIGKVTLSVPFVSGNNKIAFYTSDAAVKLDKMEIISEEGTEPNPNCTCQLSQVVLQDDKIQIAKNESSKVYTLNAQASLSGDCRVDNHADQKIIYTYQIAEDKDSIAELSGNQLTVNKEGTVKIKVTAGVNNLTSEAAAVFAVTKSTKEPDNNTSSESEPSTDNVVEDDKYKTETNNAVKIEKDKIVKETNIKKTDKATGSVMETIVKREELFTGGLNVNITRKENDSTITAGAAVNEKKELVTLNAEVALKKGNVKTTSTRLEIKAAVLDETLKEITELLASQTNNISKMKKLEYNILLPKDDKTIKEIQAESKKVTAALVKVTIPKKNDTYILKGIHLSSSVIEAAKASKKNLKISIAYSDEELMAVWSFSKNVLAKQKSSVQDVNLMLNVSTVSDADKKDAVTSIIAKDNNNTEKKSVLLSFENDKTLPAAATVTVPVEKNGTVKPGDKLYLYAVNKKAKKLEEVPNNQYTVNKAGNTAINIIKGSDYVLLPKKPSKAVTIQLADQVKVTLNNKTAKSININGKGRKADIKLTMPVTLKQVKEFSKKLEHKAVSEVKTSYKSNKPSIASVTKKGTVISKKKGKATITITITLRGGKKKTIKKSVIIK